MAESVSSAIMGQTKKLRRELISNLNKVRKGEVNNAEEKLKNKLEKEAEEL